MTIEDYRNAVFERLVYTPTEAQKKIHESDARIKLVTGGERGGKSVCGAKEAVLAALGGKLVWIAGVEFDVARTEFEYCMEDFQKLGLLKDVSFPKQGPCSMELWGGTRVVTKSAKEPQKLGMEAPDLVLLCEAAQIDYTSYLRFRGRIAEKRAPMIMTGTLEGSLGWYPEMYARWETSNDEGGQSFSLPSWSNLVVYAGGREDEEIRKLEAETPHDIFMERYAGVPCKPGGLILTEFSNAVHVGHYPYDPSLPVEIAIDPGSGVPGAYAVEAIQVKEGIIYLVAEKYLQGYITEDIIDACKKDWPWFNNIEAGVLDVAGRQRHGMPAVSQQWLDQASLHLDSKYVEVEAGIDALRTVLKVHPETGRAGLYVDAGCKGFIAEAGGGKSPIQGGGPWLRDNNTGKERDTNNHATKALAYWLVNRFGYSAKRRSRRKIKVFHY